MNTQENLISARNLRRHYHRGSETVKAIDGIDLDIHPGEMIGVTGPSGSGKTTLINLLSCLDAPTEGELTVAGQRVDGRPESELVDARRGVLGFVFQKFHLLPTLTVAENVELPLLFLRRKADRKETLRVLETVGLAERANHRPGEISGGQMQRTAIARALLAKPRILMADEPTGNLDKANGEAVVALFRRLVDETGITVILSTHNEHHFASCDRIIALEDGRIRSATAQDPA